MATAGGGLINFLRPGLRLQPIDVAATGWAFAATATSLWLIQLDWLKKQLFEKPALEQ